MKFVTTLYEPMYDHNDKKYIRIILPDNIIHRVRAKHEIDGKVLTVKVPFRYRRVMAKNMGTRPLQSLIRGDELEVDIEYMGLWTVGEHSGHSWKLTSFR